MSSEEEINLQRKYYADTAAKYDSMQISEQDEHQFALAVLSAMIEYHGIRSVLDVGSGTGRALRYLKARHPGVRFVGIEPVEALRQVGHAAGLTPAELKDGDINQLDAMDALRLLQQSDVSMALVHDEYGHLEGVVTPADLLAAIVGTFASYQDEGDEPLVTLFVKDL